MNKPLLLALFSSTLLPSISQGGESSNTTSGSIGGAAADGLGTLTSTTSGSIADLWLGAKPTVDLRLRYELGEQDGRADSNAGTARGRLGLMSGKVGGFQAFAEYEGTVTADRDSYQAASIHGLGQNRTIIADPESHDLNRAWISWAGGDTSVKLGRQRIILNNARHIGNVGWRQNEQTFDAATLTQSFGPLSLQYGYFQEVNRIFGSETPALAGQQSFEGDSHFLHATFDGPASTKMGAYGYLLDLSNGAGSANSVDNVGGYLSGGAPLGDLKLNYYAEVAYQEPGSGSPLDYGAFYYHAKADVAFGSHSVGVGYENLGSDNGVGFKFPLGTNHAFNGFADKFLGTPDEGLADFYLYGGTKLPGGVALKLFAHAFGPDGGGFDYGMEYDAVLVKKFSDRITGIAKFAYYDADEFATDTTRFTVELNYKF